MRSFGRVNGRKLRDTQQYLVDNLLPKLEIRFQVSGIRNQEIGIDEAVLAPDLFAKKAETWIEVGFGYGEHLVGMAQKYPDVNFIGCEPFINGVATLLKQIDDEKVENIRILHGDARLLIDKLPEGSIDRIFILFPDPWPKTKHQKKRFINTESLNNIARIIKTNGRLDIATDHVDYGNWIAQHLSSIENFIPNKELGIDTKPDDWVETRYQLKARAEGREARFFNYVKIGIKTSA